MLVARVYSMLGKVLPRVSSTSHILFHPTPPAHSKHCQQLEIVLSVHLYSIPHLFIYLAFLMKEDIILRGSTRLCLRALPGPLVAYMDHHLSLLPAEKGRDGHCALLQSCTSDVGLPHLANTFQRPDRMNRDDEISWISEQE